MGITDQGLEFLLSARRLGVAFDRTMTIGRQFLLVPPVRLPAMLASAGLDAAGGDLFPQTEGEPAFAEPLLRLLGAEEVDSLDGSDFEGATHVHDLNTPVPAVLSQRFTAVLDGGCLEHVFDFPTAIRSCMQMVAPGGHLLCMPPVNNAAGHGFYQFSPELYFRVLSPDNGFEVERMLLAEVRPGATWYEVVDPADAGRRIEFTTRHQAYLYVQARRIDDRPPLETPPVQSDYDDQWRHDGADGPPDPAPAPPVEATSPGARILEPLRRTARRHPVIHVPVRRARKAAASYREWRQPLDPACFKPLGRRL